MSTRRKVAVGVQLVRKSFIMEPANAEFLEDAARRLNISASAYLDKMVGKYRVRARAQTSS